jgi:hypothetical protein
MGKQQAAAARPPAATPEEPFGAMTPEAPRAFLPVSATGMVALAAVREVERGEQVTRLTLFGGTVKVVHDPQHVLYRELRGEVDDLWEAMRKLPASEEDGRG